MGFPIKKASPFPGRLARVRLNLLIGFSFYFAVPVIHFTLVGNTVTAMLYLIAFVFFMLTNRVVYFLWDSLGFFHLVFTILCMAGHTDGKSKHKKK